MILKNAWNFLQDTLSGATAITAAVFAGVISSSAFTPENGENPTAGNHTGAAVAVMVFLPVLGLVRAGLQFADRKYKQLTKDTRDDRDERKDGYARLIEQYTELGKEKALLSSFYIVGRNLDDAQGKLVEKRIKKEKKKKDKGKGKATATEINNTSVIAADPMLQLSEKKILSDLRKHLQEEGITINTDYNTMVPLDIEAPGTPEKHTRNATIVNRMMFTGFDGFSRIVLLAVIIDATIQKMSELENGSAAIDFVIIAGLINGALSSFFSVANSLGKARQLNKISEEATTLHNETNILKSDQVTLLNDINALKEEVRPFLNISSKTKTISPSFTSMFPEKKKKKDKKKKLSSRAPVYATDDPRKPIFSSGGASRA